jgi:hypothetical protein
LSRFAAAAERLGAAQRRADVDAIEGADGDPARLRLQPARTLHARIVQRAAAGTLAGGGQPFLHQIQQQHAEGAACQHPLQGKAAAILLEACRIGKFRQT